MNEQAYNLRLTKLEDFLRANPTDEWKWAEVYDVLSVSQSERAAFRRRLARDWQVGQLPWLQMRVQRGRGGIGGLQLCADPNKKGAGAQHPILALWARVTGTRRNVGTGLVKRLLEAAVAGGYVVGVEELPTNVSTDVAEEGEENA